MKYSNIITMAQFKEFLKDVDAADFWDAYETEEWESACEFAGLNYHDYDDPDALFSDLQEFAERKEKTMATKVKDANGKEIYFNAAVELMDDDIREQLHEEMAPCTDQEFFTAYEEAHKEKFGEEFVVN